MDDGGDLEARPQRGPISANYEPREPEPFKWTDAAMICLIGAFFVGLVPCGVVVIVLRRSLGPGGVPARSDTASFVLGSVLIVLGILMTPFWIFIVVTGLRTRREVEAMTRLHVVPVSRR